MLLGTCEPAAGVRIEGSLVTGPSVLKRILRHELPHTIFQIKSVHFGALFFYGLPLFWAKSLSHSTCWMGQ